MKKVWLVIATVALAGMTINAFADVQNIRLSGDIRTRGYYLNSAGGNGSGGQSGGDATFIDQRVRVSVEADLEDHVLVVVTMQAEGLWGSSSATSISGSGVPFGAQTTRTWATGVSEAYVQLNEVFYTPATLKLGRQFLQYGRGLILSSTDQEYNFDAGRLVLDYYPFTLDLVGAQLVNNQSFSSTSSSAGSADLLFVNARYEMTDSVVKDIEAYFGWVAQGSSGPINPTTVPPSVANGASPLLIGIRADLSPIENMKNHLELAYEWGSSGNVNGGSAPIKAFIVNMGLSYTFKDVQWSPTVHLNNIIASGGGDTGSSPVGSPNQMLAGGSFQPWFDYTPGYNGYVFCPALTNIRINNLGASIKPYENTTFSVEGYYYSKMDGDSFAGSNPNLGYGGLGYLPGGSNSRDLGFEIDAILGYDYSKDVRASLVYGVFDPLNAYKASGDSRCAQEVLAEINVKF